MKVKLSGVKEWKLSLITLKSEHKYVSGLRI